jgi:hypothetical protein
MFVLIVCYLGDFDVPDVYLSYQIPDVMVSWGTLTGNLLITTIRDIMDSELQEMRLVLT